MNSTKGALHFEATISNEDMKLKLTEIRQGLLDSGNTAQEQGSKIEGMFKRAALAAGAFFTAQQAVSFAKQIAVVRGEFQQLEVAFTTLLQSKSKADDLMAQMVDLAAKTPFKLTDVATGAKQLIAYGFAADDITETLTRLGNIASGLGLPMGRLTYLFGTTMTQGRLYARDLMQFTTSGIPMLQGLADLYGKSTDEINNMVTAGKIGFPEVQKVIESLTNEGGKFYNLMEQQSKTITGQISNLGDSIDVMFNNIGKSQEGVISTVLDSTKYLIEHYEEIGRVLAVLISSYGVYKAAVIVHAAAQKIAVSAGNIKAFFELAKGIKSAKDAQVALNLAMGANPLIKLASILLTVGGLIWAFARNSQDATEEVSGLAKATKDAGEEFDKEAAKIQALQSVMNNSKVAYDERKRALNELKTLIPQYNGELDKEGRIINSNTEAIKLYLTELERQIKMKAAQEELEEAYRNKRKQEKEVSEKQKAFNYAKQNTNVGIVYGEGGAEAQRHALNDAADAQVALEDAQEALQKTNNDIQELNTEIETTSATVINSTGGAVKTFSEQLAAAAENVSKYKTELADLKAGKVESKDFAKAIEDKEKELKEAQSKYDLLAGIDRKASEKNISNQVKNSEARIEAERKLKQTLVDVAFDTEQAVIDVKAEGFDKQMAQIKLNYDKKLVAIELWEREQRKVVEEAQKATFVAKGGKENDFKFNPADSTSAPVLSTISASASAQRTAATAQSAAAEKKLLDEQKIEWQGWADEYQRIEDQITKTKTDAAKARQQVAGQLKAGNIDQNRANVATKTIDTGEKSQLSNLNSEKAKLSASWKDMFVDLQGMSRREVDKLIDTINAELENKKLSAADASALFEQLEKAKDYFVGLNPFAAWVDSLGEVKAATQKVELARRRLEQVKRTGSEKELADAKKEVQDAEKQLVSDKERRAASASKSLGDIAAIAGATSDLLKTFGVESPAVDGVVSALGSLASIDFTNPISIITGGLQAISSLLGGIFGETDKAKEKKIESIGKKVDALEKSYEELGEAIDKAYSSSAAKLITQSNEMLEQQNEQIEKQKQLEQSKKKPDKGAIESYNKAIKDNLKKIEENKIAARDAIFGADLQGAIDDFASAYMDAWASGEDRAGAQKDVVKKMIRGIVQEMLKSDIKGTVEKMREQIESFMTDDVLSDWELIQIDSMGDEVGRIMEQRSKIYDRILKDDKPIEQNENSLTGQIRATMTEQTAAEFGGIWRGQFDTLKRIDIGIELGFKKIADMARTNLEIATNTFRTANNTDGLTAKIDATNAKLDTLINNTKPDNGTI